MFQSFVTVSGLYTGLALPDLAPAFLANLLKDIRAERAKITEKDNLRLLFITKWFLQFFLSLRVRASSVIAPVAGSKPHPAEEKKKAQEDLQRWNFGLISEVVERVWIVWVLKRMREAMEEKVPVFPFSDYAGSQINDSLRHGQNSRRESSV